MTPEGELRQGRRLVPIEAYKTFTATKPKSFSFHPAQAPTTYHQLQPSEHNIPDTRSQRLISAIKYSDSTNCLNNRSCTLNASTKMAGARPKKEIAEMFDQMALDYDDLLRRSSNASRVAFAASVETFERLTQDYLSQIQTTIDTSFAKAAGGVPDREELDIALLMVPKEFQKQVKKVKAGLAGSYSSRQKQEKKQLDRVKEKTWDTLREKLENVCAAEVRINDGQFQTSDLTSVCKTSRRLIKKEHATLPRRYVDGRPLAPSQLDDDTLASLYGVTESK
ncbi:hypothetical protein BP5796_03314 [Coleophoma crateriformis]|uniref:Uncharacterized protein n=1 Tax=Coleophoma crateriformis TaxID=565419 RepID=A0A3D8SMT5_9HELO|nr:hypothetical protein BP5796_03314 [Coleophoma crateriformis]